MENFNTEVNTSNQSTEAVNTTEKYPKLQELVAVLDKAMQDLNACVNPEPNKQDKIYSYEQVLFLMESYKGEILENQSYSLSGCPDMSVEVDCYAGDLCISGSIEGEVDLSNLYSSDYEIEVELSDIDSPEDAITNNLEVWKSMQVQKEEARLQAIVDMNKEVEDESKEFKSVMDEGEEAEEVKTL